MAYRYRFPALKSRELSRIVRLDGNVPAGCSATNSSQIAWMCAFDRSRYGFRKDSSRSSADEDARADIAHASPASSQLAVGGLTMTERSCNASIEVEPVRNIAAFNSSTTARSSWTAASADTR